MQAHYIWKKTSADAYKSEIKYLTNIPNKNIFFS